MTGVQTCALPICAFCDRPDNRPFLSELLAHPQYVNAPVECVRAGLLGGSEIGDPQALNFGDLTTFHSHEANEPTDQKARWIMDGLYELLQNGLFKNKALGHAPVLKNIFRRDIYQRAKAALLEPCVQLVPQPA